MNPLLAESSFSPEIQRITKQFAEELIDIAYRGVLGREPDPIGLENARKDLLEHGILAKTLSAMANSEEHIGSLVPKVNSGQSVAYEQAVQKRSHIAHSDKKILLIGNCQVQGLARLLEAMTGDIKATPILQTDDILEQVRTKAPELTALINEADFILTHPSGELRSPLEQYHPSAIPKIKMIPRINFAGFHPDIVYVIDKKGQHFYGPIGEYQSSIIFFAWKNGLSEIETKALFCKEVYELLGFDDYWQSSVDGMLEEGRLTGWKVDHLVQHWSRQGCWMHSMNHPKIAALADIAQMFLKQEGIEALPDAENYVQDKLSQDCVWPIYPELARKLGMEGHYYFKRPNNPSHSDVPMQMIGLETLIKECFDAYSMHNREDLNCSRLDLRPYQALKNYIRREKPAASPAPVGTPGIDTVKSDGGANPNPYSGLAPYQFWRRSLERMPMQDVDPVVKTRFKLLPVHKVATAGSCFAQHISRALQEHGFNYFVSEKSNHLNEDEAQRLNFGVFSARYGNLYTARQLVQLFDRAYGDFSPVDSHWLRSDGRLVDPFRPQITPDGFGSVDELLASRKEHFAAVREMFEKLDIFVFTLGLTESWQSRHDGAVFPLAPGVVAGEYRPELYEFTNFTVKDVTDDMQGFIERLKKVNPGARIIITVSPVPLIATYEDRHVLVSTTHSKSVLRAAAEEVVRAHPHCDYFPSFEIITGNYNKGAYFEDDLRSVKPEGVNHVLRLFLKHFSANAPQNDELLRELRAASEVVCDEEAIARTA